MLGGVGRVIREDGPYPIYVLRARHHTANELADRAPFGRAPF